MNKVTDLNVTFKGSLLFIAGFALAGFATQYAVILGLIGGLVAGFITSWSAVKEVPQSASGDGDNIIRSVQKIGKRIVKLGGDDDASDQTNSAEEKEEDLQASLSVLKKTKPKPEMGWFRVKYTRKSRR